MKEQDTKQSLPPKTNTNKLIKLSMSTPNKSQMKKPIYIYGSLVEKEEQEKDGKQEQPSQTMEAS